MTKYTAKESKAHIIEYPDRKEIKWVEDDDPTKIIGRHDYLLATPAREAAPEMLEALRQFVAHYPAGINPQLDDAAIAARAAIAKAEGRT